MDWFIRVLVLTVCAVASHAVEPIELTDGMRFALDSIEEAVLDGDVGGFMALVDTSDPERTTELRAWFDDLSRNPVTDFQIRYAGGLNYGPALTPAYIPISVHWTLEGDGVERSISYTAKLVPLNRNNDGPWFYAGRSWTGSQHSANDGLRVMADSEHRELASSILEIVPGILLSVERNIGRRLSKPLTVKVYPTVQELQYSVAPGYINMLSGWNEPGESIKILGRDDVSAERISSLLAHEIGHAVSFEFGPDIDNAPWWSLEGIAELVADDYRSTPPEERIIAVAKQVERGDRKSWDQLSDFRGEAVNHSMYVYSQGWSMVRFITQRYGKRARNEWFTLLCNSAPLEEATKKALGISFDDLDMEWEAEMISIAQQADD